MATEKRRFSIRNLFRRTTPKPADRKIFNIGIQEKEHGMFMTTPLLYNVAAQSVITRTCTTQLKNEVFRRGYDWKKEFALKCSKCGKEHDTPVEQCSECENLNLTKPNAKELSYAKKFLNGYVNLHQICLQANRQAVLENNQLDPEQYLASGSWSPVDFF